MELRRTLIRLGLVMGTGQCLIEGERLSKGVESSWDQFDWVLDDMKDGACFFEGYIPAVDGLKLWSSLSDLVSRASRYDFSGSVWGNHMPEDHWEKTRTPREYLEFYHSGAISLLSFHYELCVAGILLDQKLMFEEADSATTLEIICYREPILRSQNPKQAIRTAIGEFRRLKTAFGGDALFVGPDNLDYPTSSLEHPAHWLRIE